MSRTTRNQARRGIFLPQLLLVTALAATLAACGTSPLNSLDKPEPGTRDIAAVRAYGDALLQTALDEELGTGFAAAIVDSDEVLWSGSVGTMTGTTHSLPITADTPMQLGSVTKLFTALAIMQLVERDKLDLDANLRTYIPEFSIQSRFGGSDFTLRQMLTHYSGLPSDLLVDFGSDPATTRSLFESTVERTAQAHLKSPPDFAHSYSNLAFQLLGIVIERVSGEPYDAYVRQHILAPLQMTHTAVLVPDANGAWPLEQATADPREYGYEPISNLPAAALVSSVNDLTRFAQMLLAEGAGIVSQESFREMQRVQDSSARVGGGAQGLTFQLAFPPTTPQPSSGHGGALPGHYAYLRFFPGQELAVIVLQTTDRNLNVTSRLGINLRDVALEYVEPGSSKLPESAETPVRTAEQSVEEAERYAGLYVAAGLGLLEVHNNDGALTLRLDSTRLAKAKLIAAGNDTFVPSLRVLGFIPLAADLVGLGGAQLHFVFDGSRRYITLSQNGGPSQALAASFASLELGGRWPRRFGTYRPVDANGGLLAEVTLYAHDERGMLMGDALTTDGQELTLAVELLSDSAAAIAGVGRYTGELIEFVADDEFVFEGGRFRRI